VTAAIDAALRQQSVPSNLDPDLRNAAGDKAPVFVDGCLDSYTDTTVRSCAFGNTQSHQTIVLLGDSHAAQWFPALDTVANQRGWRLVVITKATCPPLEISLFSPILGRQFTECATWRANALARIRQEQPFLVVVGVARHYTDVYHFQVYGSDWMNGLTSIVHELRAVTPNVMVFGPTPKPNQDVPGCLASHLNDVPACNQLRAGAVNAVGSAGERAAVVGAGGAYLPVAPFLCGKTQCPVIVGNLLMYRDDNHLSTTVTTWLAPLVAAEIDATVHRAPAAP
jgi:hypothetical protein